MKSPNEIEQIIDGVVKLFTKFHQDDVNIDSIKYIVNLYNDLELINFSNTTMNYIISMMHIICQLKIPHIEKIKEKYG